MLKLLLVGEAKGEAEEKIDSSFVGTSGVELLRMLSEAKIIELSPFDREYISRYYDRGDPKLLDAVWSLHPEVYRTNVFQRHPPGNNLEYFCGGKSDAIPGYPALVKSKYCRREFEPELDRLAGEILAHDPNLVLCLGNTALWALTGKTGISKLRGTTLLSTHAVADFKLLPTYHPAGVLRQWELRPTVIADLMKARREMEFPEIRRPEREIWIEPTLEDIERFINDHITGCQLLSVDIETSGQRITCIGFAPNPGIALVVPFDDERAKGGHYWQSQVDERRCWELVRSILANASPKLFHNGMYDIAFLWRSMRIKVINAAEDSMLLQHSLQPEALKGLGYLGSIYSDEGSWKGMRKREKTIKRDS